MACAAKISSSPSSSRRDAGFRRRRVGNHGGSPLDDQLLVWLKVGEDGSGDDEAPTPRLSPPVVIPQSHLQVPPAELDHILHSYPETVDVASVPSATSRQPWCVSSRRPAIARTKEARSRVEEDGCDNRGTPAPCFPASLSPFPSPIFRVGEDGFSNDRAFRFQSYCVYHDYMPSYCVHVSVAYHDLPSYCVSCATFQISKLF